MIIAFWLALAALLSPWSTLVPLNAVDPITATTASPQILFNVGFWLAIAGLIWSSDWRLGLFVGYVTVNGMRMFHLGRPWTMVAFMAMGALAFTLLRERPPMWVKPLLVWSGIGQIALATCQVFWWDPVWGQSGSYQSALMNLGTIGHQTMFGAYVAIIGAIAPWWAVPIFVGGVVISGSRLAWLALGVALVVRVWPRGESAVETKR